MDRDGLIRSVRERASFDGMDLTDANPFAVDPGGLSMLGANLSRRANQQQQAAMSGLRDPLSRT